MSRPSPFFRAIPVSADIGNAIRGRRFWMQVTIGVPLGLMAASVAGLTQVGIAYAWQDAGSFSDALATPWPGQPIGMILQIFAAIAVMWLVAVKMGDRPLYEFGRAGALKEFSSGATVGFIIIGSSVLMMWLLGVYHVEEITLGRGLLMALLLGLGSAFGEEVVLRGILLRLLVIKFNVATGLIATSAIFGLLHLGNPDASMLGAVGIALQAGVLFGLAYLLTGRLWMAIGIHAAWNFTQAGIFGFNVSGVPVEPGLLVSHTSGPAWLSGGGTGVEGSVVTILIACTAAILVFLYARHKNVRNAHAGESN